MSVIMLKSNILTDHAEALVTQCIKGQPMAPQIHSLAFTSSIHKYSILNPSAGAKNAQVGNRSSQMWHYLPSPIKKLVPHTPPPPLCMKVILDIKGFFC